MLIDTRKLDALGLDCSGSVVYAAPDICSALGLKYRQVCPIDLQRFFDGQKK